MNRLTDYHDAEDPLVFRWGEFAAAVQLSRWCITIVPSEGVELEPPEAKFIDGLTQLLRTKPSHRRTTSFGLLSMWANRRRLANAIGDPQTVLDAIYNRQVIRESLQWLYQHRVPHNTGVHMRTVPTDGHDSKGEPMRGRALIMTCDRWTGVVMNCIAEHGGDPLFPALEETAP